MVSGTNVLILFAFGGPEEGECLTPVPVFIQPLCNPEIYIFEKEFRENICAGDAEMSENHIITPLNAIHKWVVKYQKRIYVVY